jgi:hypothetical protein
MREEEDGGGGVGWTVYPVTVIYSASGNCVKSQPSTAKWKRPGCSSRPRVSTRAPRRPLRAVIKETAPVISHPRAGRAVKFCQRPRRTAGGPTIRLVLAGSGRSCRR